MNRFFVAVLILFGFVHAEGQTSGGISNLAGTLYASNFSGWTVPSGNNGPFSWSSSQVCTYTTTNNATFQPFIVGSPIRIVDTSNPALSETVTPTAVNILGSGCSITVAPVNTHYSFYLTSATAGLQEAINFANNNLYTVLVTPDFTRLGGTTSTITGAKGNTNVTILDERNAVIVAYTWNGTLYVAQSFGGGATIKTNGTNNADQTTLNFQDTTGSGGIKWTNPSAGNEQATAPALLPGSAMTVSTDDTNHANTVSFLATGALNVIGTGDSVCFGVGATQQANAWWYILTGAIAVTATNNCVSGSTLADAVNSKIYSGSSGPVNYVPCFASTLWTSESGINNARLAGSTDPNAMIGYMQTYFAGEMAKLNCSATLITPNSTAFTLTGSNSILTYYRAFKGILLTSDGANARFSITTTRANQPIYLSTLAWNPDPSLNPGFVAGQQQVAVDSTVVTDTVTGASSLPNTLFNNTPVVQVAPFPSVPMGQRYIVPTAGTHAVDFTCTTAGSKGCVIFFATTNPFNKDYFPAGDLIYGVIPQQGLTNEAAMLAYDGLNKSVYTTWRADGYPVTFADVHPPFVTNNAVYMSSTDGTTNLGLALHDITVNPGDGSGGLNITSTGYTFTPQDACKPVYVEGAGVAGATLYTTIACSFATVGNTAQMSTAGSTAITSGTAYLGELGQIFPASTNPGLHPNDVGHAAMGRIGLNALQAITVAPPLSLALNPGQVLSVNKNNIASTNTTGPVQNPGIEVYSPTATNGYGMRLGYHSFPLLNNVSINSLDLYATNGPIDLCPSGNKAFLQSYTCPHQFYTSFASIGAPLSTVGNRYNITRFIAGFDFFVPQASNHIYSLDITSSSIATPLTITLPSVGSVTSLSSATLGTGMSTGTYVINAPSACAGGTPQISVTVVSATTFLVNGITNTASGCTTPPVFTVPTGNNPTVTSVIATGQNALVQGQEYSFKRTDSTAGKSVVVTAQGSAGAIDGVANATITVAPLQTLTVFWDSNTGWNIRDFYKP